jgi:hypothetical protein
MPISMGSLGLEGAAEASCGAAAAGALDMAETDEGEGFPRGKSTEGANVAGHRRLLRNALIFNSLHDFHARQRDGLVGQAFPSGTACFAEYGK